MRFGFSPCLGVSGFVVTIVAMLLSGCGARPGPPEVDNQFEGIPAQYTNAQIADWLADMVAKGNGREAAVVKWRGPMVVRLEDKLGHDLDTDEPPGSTLKEMLERVSAEGRWPLQIIDAKTPGNDAAIVVGTFDDRGNDRAGRIDTLVAAGARDADTAFSGLLNRRGPGTLQVEEFIGPPNMFCANTKESGAIVAFAAWLIMPQKGSTGDPRQFARVVNRCLLLALDVQGYAYLNGQPNSRVLGDLFEEFAEKDPIPFIWLLNDPKLLPGMSFAAARGLFLRDLAQVRPESTRSATG